MRSKSKRHRSHSKRNHTKFDMKLQAAQLFEKIKAFVSDPSNIFYFILGIISAFNEKVEGIYHKIKDFIGAIKPCIATFKTAYAAYAKLTEGPIESHISGPLKNVEEAFNKHEGKKEYCEKTKEQIYQNFENALDEDIKNQGIIGEVYSKMTPGIIKNLTTKIISSTSSEWNYCMSIRYGKCPLMQEEILKKYKNPFIYEQQCLYFHNLNCNNFSPDTNGLWEFVKKADKLYDFLGTSGKCIHSIVNEVEGTSGDKSQEFRNLLKEIFPKDQLIKDAMAAAIGVILNITTLGAWGGLKAGYYILDLSEKIEKYYKDALKDAPFKIGNILGNGMLIAKTFITGRRRKFRKN